MTVKQLKAKDKEKTGKSPENKNTLHKGTIIRLQLTLHPKLWKPEQHLKSWKKNCQSRIVYQEKLSFKIEGEIKTLLLGISKMGKVELEWNELKMHFNGIS